MYAPEGLKFSPGSLKPVWTCQTPVLVSHLNAVSLLLSKCLISRYAYRIGALLKNVYSDILKRKQMRNFCSSRKSGCRYSYICSTSNQNALEN